MPVMDESVANWYIDELGEFSADEFESFYKHVQTSQTPTVLHDHEDGEDCGDCEHWNDGCLDCGHEPADHEDTADAFCTLCDCLGLYIEV